MVQLASVNGLVNDIEYSKTDEIFKGETDGL
jgi:hypothetical protein